MKTYSFTKKRGVTLIETVSAFLIAGIIFAVLMFFFLFVYKQVTTEQKEEDINTKLYLIYSYVDKSLINSDGVYIDAANNRLYVRKKEALDEDYTWDCFYKETGHFYIARYDKNALSWLAGEIICRDVCDFEIKAQGSGLLNFVSFNFIDYGRFSLTAKCAVYVKSDIDEAEVPPWA